MPVALAGLGLRRGLLQRQERDDQIGRLLRLWVSLRAGIPVRVGILQRARNDATTAAGPATPPIKIALDTSASAFGHKAGKLHRAIFNEIRGGGEKPPISIKLKLTGI